MTDKSKTTWEIELCGDSELDRSRRTRLLSEGWEPFAVSGNRIWFKRVVQNV